MRCPSCQQELPVECSEPACPFCGQNLPEAPALASATVAASGAHFRISWPAFFACLFAPLLLTILVVKLASDQSGAAPAVALIGGGASGIICGILLGRRLGKTFEARLAFSILFILIMAVACIGMNCFGCLAGGFRLDLK